MRAGKDFTLRLRRCRRAGCGMAGTAGCSRASEDAGNCCSEGDGACDGPVLKLLFRPAEVDQLRAEMPAIGIPPMLLPGSDVAPPISAAPQPGDAAAPPERGTAELQPGTPSSADIGQAAVGLMGPMGPAGGPAGSSTSPFAAASRRDSRDVPADARHPLYFFAVLQPDRPSVSRTGSGAASRAGSGSASQTLTWQPAAPSHQTAAQRLGANNALARPSPRLPSSSGSGPSSMGTPSWVSGISPSDMTPMAVGSPAQLGAEGGVPAFYQVRPQVLQEVTLGPLIGTGSMGRCYRGLWQVRRLLRRAWPAPRMGWGPAVAVPAVFPQSVPTPRPASTCLHLSLQGGRVAVKIIDCRVASSTASPHSSAPADAHGLSGAPRSMCPQAAMLEALLARSMAHPQIVTTYAHAVGIEERPDGCGSHQQVWIVQEFCSRGCLFDAIDKGLLQEPGGGPNMRAVLTCAQEIAGAV